MAHEMLLWFEDAAAGLALAAFIASALLVLQVAIP